MLVKKESQEVSLNSTVNMCRLKKIKSFVYLGSIISSDGICLKEIEKKIALTKKCLLELERIFKKRSEHQVKEKTLKIRRCFRFSKRAFYVAVAAVGHNLLLRDNTMK